MQTMIVFAVGVVSIPSGVIAGGFTDIVDARYSADEDGVGSSSKSDDREVDAEPKELENRVAGFLQQWWVDKPIIVLIIANVIAVVVQSEDAVMDNVCPGWKSRNNGTLHLY